MILFGKNYCDFYVAVLFCPHSCLHGYISHAGNCEPVTQLKKKWRLGPTGPNKQSKPWK